MNENDEAIHKMKELLILYRINEWLRTMIGNENYQQQKKCIILKHPRKHKHIMNRMLSRYDNLLCFFFLSKCKNQLIDMNFVDAAVDVAVVLFCYLEFRNRSLSIMFVRKPSDSIYMCSDGSIDSICFRHFQCFFSKLIYEWIDKKPIVPMVFTKVYYTTRCQHNKTKQNTRIE